MNKQEFEERLQAVCREPEAPVLRRMRERVRRRVERHLAAHPEITQPFLEALAQRTRGTASRNG